MDKLNRNTHPVQQFPEKVLQFGEGNFLRGFVDWMIHRLNLAGRFGGRVVVIQPIAHGLAGKLNEQDGLYTLLLRGVEDGKPVDRREVIASISRAINPYEQFDQFLATAANPDLSVIVSNTTEAGIVFRPEDCFDDRPPASFPGKLTRLLFARFSKLGQARAPGLVIIPCELIERNGDALRDAVLANARHWKLDEPFMQWLESANVFANSLVDRIVTGHPKDDAARLEAELGYRDELMVAGEPFHLWVIEAPPHVARLLPFHEIGLNVVFTNNMKPYRDRKVRILNGAHTMTAPAAFLMGLDTVGQCMGDPTVREFLEQGLRQEIIPTLDLPRSDLDSFAAAVLERFSNPHVRHELLSITLNTVSKFKARLLPSIKGFAAARGLAPERLAFAAAGMIAFYRPAGAIDGTRTIGRRGDASYPIQDDAEALCALADAWKAHGDNAAGVAASVLSNNALWGENLTALPGFAAAVAKHLSAIRRDPRAAMAAIA